MAVEIMGQAVPQPTSVQSPAQRIIADAPQNEVRQVTSSAGRVIRYRPMLEALAEMRLAASVGAELSQNEGYMQFARIAARVVQIDEHPLSSASRREIEHTVQMLGNAGLTAILEDMQARQREQEGEAPSTFPGSAGSAATPA